MESFDLIVSAKPRFVVHGRLPPTERLYRAFPPATRAIFHAAAYSRTVTLLAQPATFSGIWFSQRFSQTVEHPDRVRFRRRSCQTPSNRPLPNQSPGPLTPGGHAHSPPPMCAMYS